MHNIRGYNLNGETLWEGEEIPASKFSGQTTWIGTGIARATNRGYLLVRHVNVKSALEFYLENYPETDMIHHLNDAKFHQTNPQLAVVKSKLDSICEALGIDIDGRL